MRRRNLIKNILHMKENKAAGGNPKELGDLSAALPKETTAGWGIRKSQSFVTFGVLEHSSSL
jgi:hypothetical protein